MDWLEVAFEIDVPPTLCDELAERQSIADLAGTAELKLAGLTFALAGSRRFRVVNFENADARGTFDPTASDGWIVVIAVRATFLATSSLGEAAALCRRIAQGFGVVRRERLRRFDLAADFAGFGLEPLDIERVHTRARRKTTFLADAKDKDGASSTRAANLREYRKAPRQVTGITVAPGNVLMARLYDKTEELSLPGREAKRAIEHELWRVNGWDGVTPVTRVEFQHRGEYIAEIGLRTDCWGAPNMLRPKGRLLTQAWS